MALEFADPTIQRFMEQTLGSPMDKVFHATVPFQFGFENGGASDVYLFKRKDGYVSYVTGDLIGQKQKESDAGNYELLCIMRDGEDWGAKLIRMLSYATLDESINSGETMDIGDFGRSVGFGAIIFDKYGETESEGSKIGIMLVIGITKQELDWKIKNSGSELLEKLKTANIYPYSVPKRKSLF